MPGAQHIEPSSRSCLPWINVPPSILETAPLRHSESVGRQVGKGLKPRCLPAEPGSAVLSLLFRSVAFVQEKVRQIPEFKMANKPQYAADAARQDRTTRLQKSGFIDLH